MEVITKAKSTAIFLCIRPFSAKQLGNPRASLLLITDEKAVFCKIQNLTNIRQKKSSIEFL